MPNTAPTEKPVYAGAVLATAQIARAGAVNGELVQVDRRIVGAHA